MIFADIFYVNVEENLHLDDLRLAFLFGDLRNFTLMCPRVAMSCALGRFAVGVHTIHTIEEAPLGGLSRTTAKVSLSHAVSIIIRTSCGEVMRQYMFPVKALPLPIEDQLKG